MTDNPRPDKAQAVAELTDKFRESSATVLTEYRGMTMSELTTLRRALGRETTYKVSKNTLTKRAASEAGVTGLDDLLVGPTAIAFVGGDPVEAAKGLRDFARTHPALVIKGGVVDGRPVSADDIRTLADLESREVLLAKLAGAMKGTLGKAAGLFQAPLSQVARLAAALQEKKAAEPQPAAAAAAEAPAEAAGDEAPASDAAEASTEG
jgi:large subunit ribosomal protein L10